MMRTRTFEVTVHGFPPVVYSALSAAKARVEAWRNFCSAYECTFKAFLRISKVRGCDAPREDGYDSVRRQYGVDVKIGQRVALQNEGTFSGMEGEVVYPGRSTCYIHVLLDGREHASVVHPMSIATPLRGRG